jgi:hypothetical protein
LLAEIKAVLKRDYVDEHLERIEIVRRYMDNKGDDRKIIGAVAGGVVHADVLNYAQKNGLYVAVQSGDSVRVAKMSKGFKPRVW